jgi:hypothetical protein
MKLAAFHHLLQTGPDGLITQVHSPCGRWRLTAFPQEHGRWRLSFEAALPPGQLLREWQLPGAQGVHRFVHQLAKVLASTPESASPEALLQHLPIHPHLEEDGGHHHPGERNPLDHGHHRRPDQLKRFSGA